MTSEQMQAIRGRRYKALAAAAELSSHIGHAISDIDDLLRELDIVRQRAEAAEAALQHALGGDNRESGATPKERARFWAMEAATQKARAEAAEAALVSAREELADVLEIAIARGETLGYSDDDYHARLRELRPKSLYLDTELD